MQSERVLVERLRSRDETAFLELVRTHHNSMLALARLYVSSAQVAEEVVQDAWLAVVKGIDAFESRSALKTWISRIVMNLARTRGVREKRAVTFSEFVDAEIRADYHPVDGSRFQRSDGEYPDHWSINPRSWNLDPEQELVGRETMAAIQIAVAALPVAQRLVITLRDINGWSGEEVCNVMELSETNQRVLLHRARSRVRARLEDQFSPPGRVEVDV